MTHREFTKRVLIVLGLLSLAALLIFTTLKIVPLLVILFTAWITAETLDIGVRFLMRKKFPRWLAVTVTMLVVLLFAALLILIIVPPVSKELANLLSMVKLTPEVINQMTANYENFRQSISFLSNILPPAPEELPQVLLGQNGINGVISSLESALPILTDIGTFVGATLGKIILYIFLTILLMLEPDIYYETLIQLLPERFTTRANEILTMVRKNVESWSGAMLLSIGITSFLYEVVLGFILGLPDALALSVIAGIATIIPTVGNTLALIPVILVAAPLGPTRLILAIALYVVIGTAQDRIITPAIMRTELSIPVALLIFFQLTLVTLIGPLGLVLAVPLLAILITLVREIYVYDILGKRPEEEAPAEEPPSAVIDAIKE